MNTSSHIPEYLSGLHRRSEEARARVRDELVDRRGEPPRVGEIFTFPKTAPSGIAWAVVEEQGQGQFLVVAADLEPFVGSADVEGGHASAWILRSRFALRLEAPEFATARRIALLETDVVDRILEMRVALSRRTYSEESDVDRETQYQDHLEELARAREALARRGGLGRLAEPKSRAPLDLSPSVRQRPFRPIYALAATLLVALTLGVVALSQQREIRRLERDRHQPVANLTYTVFTSSGGTRGEEKSVSLAPDERFFMLIFWVSDDYPHYQMEVRPRDSDSVIWTGGELAERDSGGLTVLLPRFLFPDGEYRIRVEGLRGGRAQLLYEYVLTVESR